MNARFGTTPEARNFLKGFWLIFHRRYINIILGLLCKIYVFFFFKYAHSSSNHLFLSKDEEPQLLIVNSKNDQAGLS